jgi:hypothetical protein
MRYQLRRLAEARLQSGGLSRGALSLYEQLCALEQSLLATDDHVPELCGEEVLEYAERARQYEPDISW